MKKTFDEKKNLDLKMFRKKSQDTQSKIPIYTIYLSYAVIYQFFRLTLICHDALQPVFVQSYGRVVARARKIDRK